MDPDQVVYDESFYSICPTVVENAFTHLLYLGINFDVLVLLNISTPEEILFLLFTPLHSLTMY